jgi:hypothetical protein
MDIRIDKCKSFELREYLKIISLDKKSNKLKFSKIESDYLIKVELADLKTK